MLFKRPGSDYWQIKFTLNGRTVRRSSQTNDKRLAERIEHAARQSIIQGMISGVVETPSFTWEQAVKLWITEKDAKRSIDTDYSIFKSLKKYFAGVEVRDIKAIDIAKYCSITVRRTSPSTANRHLSLLRAVMNRLVALEILDKAPLIELLPTDTVEPPWVTPEQIQAVLEALPDYARDIAEFAVLTGLRRGNVLQMRWKWIDLVRKVVIVPASGDVVGARAKGKRTLVVPLSDEALAVLERRQGIHAEFVFTGPEVSEGEENPSAKLTQEQAQLVKVAMQEGWATSKEIARYFKIHRSNVYVILNSKSWVSKAEREGKPLATIKRPWATATAKAGVPTLRFHDLRHAWASFHTMNQTPDRVLQALGGWSSNKMVQRYAHLKPDALAQYAGNARLK